MPVVMESAFMSPMPAQLSFVASAPTSIHAIGGGEEDKDDGGVKAIRMMLSLQHSLLIPYLRS
jgi:hypothetical protein